MSLTAIGRLIRKGALLTWDSFWMVWLAEIFWLLLCLPVVTIPLAFTGLHFSMTAVARGDTTTWHTFFRGIRQYWQAGLRWSAANALVIFVLGFYTWFFSAQGNAAGQVSLNALLGAVAAWLLLAWLVLNFTTFPLMLMQVKPGYFQALRNSVALFLKWPGGSLVFALLNLAIIALSLWLRFPWLLFGASLPALMSALLAADRVEALTAGAPPPPTQKTEA
jgi:hypothetical protein